MTKIIVVRGPRKVMNMYIFFEQEKSPCACLTFFLQCQNDHSKTFSTSVPLPSTSYSALSLGGWSSLYEQYMVIFWLSLQGKHQPTANEGECYVYQLTNY